MGVIQFITKRTDHDELIYKSSKINVISHFETLKKYLDISRPVGFDVESNRGRLFQAKILLISLGDSENLFVVDCTSVLDEFVEVWNTRQSHLKCFAHNWDFDRSITSWHGIRVNPFWDTMIADQRLNLGLGVSNSLAAVYARRLKIFMPEDKKTRLDFLTMDYSSKFTHQHILYSAADPEKLIDIANVQRAMLVSRNQFDFVFNTEMSLISILVNMKLEGMHINEDKLKNLITTWQTKKLFYENEMDKEVARFLNKAHVDRRRGEYTALDLFGQHKTVENTHSKRINYSSPKMVLDFIEKLKLPLPTLKEKGSIKPSTKEQALQRYLIEHPDTSLRSLIENLIEYRGYQKLITTYGNKFLNSTIYKKKGREPGYKNPITNKVHTIYRQCMTDNGRLASGSKDKKKKGELAIEALYNSQNIPTLQELKAVFCLTEQEIAEGWWLTEVDLTAAELNIMAAMANDMHLYTIGKGDLHSPIATKCWRAVAAYRIKEGRSMVILDSKGKKYTLTEDFLIDKKNNKQLRTDFKRQTFGTIYNMQAKKAGETLNIPKNEGQIMIDVIENEFPDTFRLVKQAAKNALTDGYCIFNPRSNNRRWFPEVLAALQRIGNEPNREKRYEKVRNILDFNVISDVEGYARNVIISGTQADMLKEGLVTADKYCKENNIEYIPLLTVHDSVVFKHKDKDLGGKIAEIFKNTANLYLSLYSDTIRMEADYITDTYWKKDE